MKVGQESAQMIWMVLGCRASLQKRHLTTMSVTRTIQHGMVECQWTVSWNGFGRTQSWPKSRYYPAVPVGTEENSTNLNQGSLSWSIFEPAISWIQVSSVTAWANSLGRKGIILSLEYTVPKSATCDRCINQYRSIVDRRICFCSHWPIGSALHRGRNDFLSS
jgi:hypothetical protein